MKVEPVQRRSAVTRVRMDTLLQGTVNRELGIVKRELMDEVGAVDGEVGLFELEDDEGVAEAGELVVIVIELCVHVVELELDVSAEIGDGGCDARALLHLLGLASLNTAQRGEDDVGEQI